MVPTATAPDQSKRGTRESPRSRCWRNASTARGRMSSTPTFLVAAARAPVTPASAHFLLLADHREVTTRSRNNDSEYGASRKYAVGKTARYNTVRRAVRSSNSDDVRKYRTASAPRNTPLEMRMPAARGWPPRIGEATRMSIG